MGEGIAGSTVILDEDMLHSNLCRRKDQVVWEREVFACSLGTDSGTLSKDLKRNFCFYRLNKRNALFGEVTALKELLGYS